MRARLITEKRDFSVLPNENLKDLVNENPESKDGVIAKIELKRRKEVNGEDLNESGGYPVGAENDPNAPYNQGGSMNKPVRPKDINFIAIHVEDDWVVLEDKDNERWVFYREGIDKKELTEYADDIPIKHEQDETGSSYGIDDEYLEDWEPNEETFTNAINDYNNKGLIEFGEGMEGYESEADMIKVDTFLQQELSHIPWYQI